MMAGLLPYTGPRAECPKCAVPNATTKYQAGSTFSRSDRLGGSGESLIRTCRNCEYQWAEACKNNHAAEPVTPDPDGEG